MNAHAQPPPTEDLIGDVERLESVISGWAGSEKNVALAYGKAIEALHRAALRKLITDVKEAPGALEALRAATADPTVYAVLRRHGLVRPSLQERVEEALATIRPMLATHGGDVELVAVVPPDRVEVRFLGNCDHCPASTLTFVAGVERAIAEHCPEIKEVRQIKGPVGARAAVCFESPFTDHRWRFALTLDAIPEGGIEALVIDDEAFLFARIGDKVTCFRDACAHLGVPLSRGRVRGGRITCPHHGFVYDLATGECLTVPEVQLAPIAVRRIGDRIDIRREG